jgi:hypothetical protein
MKLPEDIVITGHTDAAPFPGIGRTNWELSTERAMSTRLLLAQSGLLDKRFRSVAGNADRDPLLPSDPLSPANRRIAIVLLRSAPGGGTRASQPLTPEGAAAAGVALTRGGNRSPAAPSLQPLNNTAPPIRPLGLTTPSVSAPAVPAAVAVPAGGSGAAPNAVPAAPPATPTTR